MLNPYSSLLYCTYSATVVVVAGGAVVVVGGAVVVVVPLGAPPLGMFASVLIPTTREATPKMSTATTSINLFLSVLSP